VRFVHIYRNPYVVFASTCRALRTVLRELALQPHEHVPVHEAVLDLYPQMMRRLLEEADRLPGDSIVHVRFEELERDPLGQVERIYRSIKLDGSIELDGYEVARPRIETYLRSIQHYTKATHTFSKASVRRVTQRWQPFIACFGYHQPDLERYAA
jgi:omega-hydroxy-beta-dihydromenaquinone-9 sulfotransferase